MRDAMLSGRAKIVPDQRKSLLWRTEIALWVGAGLCCLAGVFPVAESAWARSVALSDFPAGRSHAAVAPVVSGAKASKATAVLGRLEIPALGVEVPITRGIDAVDLTRGVGHITGSALPGGLGTVGLAGHRDTYLRSLRRVALGMDIELVDEQGTFHYTVNRTEVVTPDQVSVLFIESKPKLVLITCYPFDFVGAAPRRFVVHADLVSVTPDE